jgi:hypothetical protein
VLSVVPVRFAEAFETKKVIAIDTFYGRGYSARKNTLWSTTQAFRLQMFSGSESELKEANWLLQPDFEPEIFISFVETEDAIRAGYEAMKNLLPTLKAGLYVKIE